MESWMVTVALSVGTFIGVYAVTKYKVDEGYRALEEIKKDSKEHDKLDSKHHDEINIRISDAFKKIDMVSTDVTILQRDTVNHLDMNKAEEKFVSKEELSLHLKNIDSELNHINRNSEMMVGKLDDLTKALSQYMLRQLNDGDD